MKINSTCFIKFFRPLFQESQTFNLRFCVKVRWEVPLVCVSTRYKKVKKTFFCWLALPGEALTVRILGFKKCVDLFFTWVKSICELLEVFFVVHTSRLLLSLLYTDIITRLEIWAMLPCWGSLVWFDWTWSRPLLSIIEAYLLAASVAAQDITADW